MTLNEYQKLALCTANLAKGYNLRLAVAAMGLSGEASEVLELIDPSWSDAFGDRDKLVKELGDVMWYVAEMGNILNFDLESIDIPETAKNLTSLLVTATGVAIHAGQITDYLKKVIGHDHPIDISKVQTLLGVLLSDMLYICDYIRVPLPDICNQNIEKLRRRYPMGFSTERSLGRIQ